VGRARHPRRQAGRAAARVVCAWRRRIFFLQQQNDAQRAIDNARLEATKKAEAELEAARDKLITTYNSLGSLSEQQIENIKKVLEVNKQVTLDIEEQRGKLSLLEKEIANREGELAAARVENAKLNDEQAKAKAELEAARVELAARQVDVEKRAKETERLSSELAAKQRAIDTQQAQIDQQLAKIGKLKSDVSLLANDVYGSARSEQTAAIARRVVEETPSDILMAAAEAPSADTVERLDSLIGVPVSTFETGLRDGKHGYSTWLRVTTPGEKRQAYVGVGTPDARNAKLSRAIMLETDGELISSIDPPIGDVILLRLNNPEQWFGRTDYLVGRFEPARNYEVIKEFPANEDTVWSFASLIPRDSPGAEVAVAHGDPSPDLIVLDAIALKRDYGEIAAGLASTPSYGLAIAMAERAAAFNPAQLDLREVEAAFPDVAQALRRMVAAGVARNMEELGSFVAPLLRPEDVGRLVAIVLRSRVELYGAIDVTDLVRAESARAASSVIQAPVYSRSDKAGPPPAPEEAEARRYVEVSVRYATDETLQSRPGEAVLRLEVEPGASGWRLSAIRGADSRAAQTAY